jgi:hypothetical protein
MAGAASTSRGNAGVDRAETRRPASRGDPPPKIREAFSNAVADGVRLHVPSTIGILAIGVPTCALASFAHFVLGLSPPVTSAAGGAGTIAYMVRQLATGR